MDTNSVLMHVMFVAAIWGYLVSWVNEFIKQDSLPTWVNTVIANAVMVGSAALVTWQAAPAFTLSAFGHALFGAFAAAVINHQFILTPKVFGDQSLGDKIQTLTSFKK